MRQTSSHRNVEKEKDEAEREEKREMIFTIYISRSTAEEEDGDDVKKAKEGM